ncbi:iron uptake transporter deferrochelatase/peroxidase subunit [Canibacter zhoujuaniae]|uniref:iron uptake transporter deferrochelatase/peroxidase subunit n=1 Tax=Canibacter zhoujuaniae TaxID=2708343 RepID=UPI00141DD5FD|nr:iron uptake transporter deferrochelatase/peroxidase subunit [Canibacter zhoujuaniae]
MPENSRSPESVTPSALAPSRRAVLGALGAGVVGAAFGSIATASALSGNNGVGGSKTVDVLHGTVPFEGEHQAGITTEAQDRLHFAAFDLVRSATRDDLISLLKDWTAAARLLTQGKEVGTGAIPEAALLPPDDTGEALGLGAANLTLTFGFGRSLFADKKNGRETIADPYGLRAQLPPEFVELPLFAFDLLKEEISGGDLCVQACADDPQVAVHAIRNLARIAVGRAHLRWSQLGFGRTSATTRAQATPRNLFGFKDGTTSIKAEDSEALANNVFVQAGVGVPQWFVGGTYLVARKIQMTIEIWDRQNLAEQERVIGRNKLEGAYLSGGSQAREHDAADFTARDATGEPLIDVDAHVKLAHPENNEGVQLLRRGYNYVDGSNDLGQLNAGLFFISFQNDPAKFIRVQNSLKSDLLNEYIRHIGSGLWLVPPGVGPGEYIGQSLFNA